MVSIDYRHRVFLPPPKKMSRSLEMILGDRESLLESRVRGVLAVGTTDCMAFLEVIMDPSETNEDPPPATGFQE